MSFFTHGNLPALVMFDLDGTLVDSVPDLAAAVDSMLEQLGCAPAGEDLVRSWVGNGQWALVERALSHAGLAQAPSLAEAVPLFRRAYAACSSNKTRLYEGVRPFLEWLAAAGIDMAIVTNKPKEFVPGILNELGIGHFFRDVIGGECLTEKKPHPLPLLDCLQRFSVTADKAVMIGDSSNDLVAAERAGVASIAVSYGYAHGIDLSVYNPMRMVDSLVDLVQPSLTAATVEQD